MIELHRLNGSSFWLNHRQIELIEAHPDTVVRLNNDKRYIVKEKPEEIAEKITLYERKIFQVYLPGSVDTGKE